MNQFSGVLKFTSGVSVLGFKDARYMPVTNNLYWFWFRHHNRQPYCRTLSDGSTMTIL